MMDSQFIHQSANTIVLRIIAVLYRFLNFLQGRMCSAESWNFSDPFASYFSLHFWTGRFLNVVSVHILYNNTTF